MDCGYDKDPAALQFDHVRGEKLVEIGKVATNVSKRVLDEIEKCEVVCANCHAIRTTERSLGIR